MNACTGIGIVLCGVWLLSLSALPAPGATTPPPAPGKTLSLDVQHADVRDVLRLLAETAGLNILASPAVQGQLTVRLLEVPWEQALDAVLQLTGLAQERQGNVILVAPAEHLRQARQERQQARHIAAGTEASITRVVPVNYASASALQTSLQQLLGACATVLVDQRTNALILRGTPTCLQRLGGDR